MHINKILILMTDYDLLKHYLSNYDIIATFVQKEGISTTYVSVCVCLCMYVLLFLLT